MAAITNYVRSPPGDDNEKEFLIVQGGAKGFRDTKSASDVDTVADVSVDDGLRIKSRRQVNASVSGNSGHNMSAADEENFPDTDSADNTTNLASIMNLLKANIGTGILAMPNAFTNAGLVVGLVSILFMGVVCVHCMHMLVLASRYFCRRFNYSSLSYPVVVRLAFEHSPLKRFARLAQRTVSAFLFITQIGFCCVYIVFVARSVENLLGLYWHAIPIWKIELALLPFLLPLVMIRDLRRLAALSLAANIIMFVGLGIIFQEMLTHLQPVSSLPAAAPVERWPKFFGTAIFAFEGIGCLLPIENKMRYPRDFGGWFGVLNLTMVIVTVLYGAVGYFGFLSYGNGVAASITYSLPHQPVYQAVKAFMAVAIFFSYGLQFYVPMRQLISRFRRQYASIARQRFAEYIARIGLLLLTLGLAVIIPHLAEFIALIGAFASSFLALIFPAILDLVYRYDMPPAYGARYGSYGLVVWKNIAILVFGLAGFIFGTMVAVQDIILKFSHPDDD